MGSSPCANLPPTRLARLARLSQAVRGASRMRRTAVLRRAFDELFGDRVFDVRFEPVDCAGVPAEWVLAPGHDAARRLLYIHGGAWIMGSPLRPPPPVTG